MENSSVVKKPTDFVKMYESTRSSGNDKDTSNYSIWRPVAILKQMRMEKNMYV